MSKLDLQIRNLETGDRGRKTFDDEATAIAWLKERPKFTEVLGVASFDTPREVSDRLKAAMRPLEEAELLLIAEQKSKAEEALRKQAEARRKKEVEAAAQRKEEMANADPNRPMEVRWHYDDGFALLDQADPREIPEVVRSVIKEWVAERNEWVKGRGQVVGDARITAYPGPLPEGKTERILSGTFIPVTAPAEQD